MIRERGPGTETFPLNVSVTCGREGNRGSALNSTVQLYFPVGDENDDFQNQVTVYVSNFADYRATVYLYPITVSAVD